MALHYNDKFSDIIYPDPKPHLRPQLRPHNPSTKPPSSQRLYISHLTNGGVTTTPSTPGLPVILAMHGGKVGILLTTQQVFSHL